MVNSELASAGVPRAPRRGCAQRYLRGFCLVVAVACGLFLVGCSQDEGRLPVFPVSGKVAFDGEVPEGALVVFHPARADEKAPRPSAKVKQDGTFTITTYDGDDGAPAGDYSVTIQWFKLVKKGADVSAGPNVLPEKYSVPASSPWKVSVAESKNELTSYTITK